jgi:hypothetical protein
MSLENISNPVIKSELEKYESTFDKAKHDMPSLELQTTNQLKAIQHYLQVKRVGLSTDFTAVKNDLVWRRASANSDYEFTLGGRKIDDWSLEEKVAVLSYMPQYITIVGDKITKLLGEANHVLSAFANN